MSSFVFQTGATSKSITVRAYDSTTFLPKTALVYNSAGLTAYYREGATGTPTAITLVTQTVGGAYSSGGFVLLDDTNMHGLYRLDLPNAALDAGAGALVSVLLKATGVIFQPVDIVLTADDPTSAAATTGAMADALIGRNIAGGSAGGRTVGQALAVNRNKIVVDRVAGTITVYDTDDTTVLWSGTVAKETGAHNPIKTMDPA